jgi:Flp pilus assembly protein TadD
VVPPGEEATSEQALRQAVRTRPSQARVHFELGTFLARNGDTSGALRSLRRASVLQPDLPGVQRELGAAYLELELAPLAGRALSRALAQDPADAGAQMLQGLLDQREGDHTAALLRFETAQRLDARFAAESAFNSAVSHYRTGNLDAARESLVRARSGGNAVIARQAERLDEQIRGERRAARRWSVSISAGAFYDDNVTVSSIDQATGVGDAGLSLDLGAEYRLYQDDASQLEVSYDFSQTVYEDLSSFNLQTHSLGAYAERTVRGVDLSLGYGYSYTLLGGDNFLGSHSLRPSIGYAFGDRIYATAGYRFSADNFIDDTDRDAVTHGVGAQAFYLFMGGRAYVSAGASFEDEHTVGREFEYRGETYDLGVKLPLAVLPLEPTLRARYQYYDRDYDNVTPAIGEARRDERHTVTVSLEAAINSWLSGRLEYEHIDARSNLASSDFKENIFGFSLDAQF